MNPLLKLIVGSYFLLFCSFGFAQPKECEKALTLTSTTDWFPFIYRTTTGASKGTDVQLLRTILNEMNCKLEVLHFPERRALFVLSDGDFDIGLGATKTKKREVDFHYSIPYRIEVNRFAYSQNQLELTNATNFQNILALNKVIAINLAGWYGQEIEHAKSTYDNFVFSSTAQKRLTMLSLSRVDVVIDDQIVLCSELERAPYGGLILHPMELYKADIHFIFNKNTVSEAFVDMFNQILMTMEKSGSLAAHYYAHLPTACNSNQLFNFVDKTD